MQESNGVKYLFFAWSEIMFFMLKSLSLAGERISLEGTFGFVFDFDSIQGFMDDFVYGSKTFIHKVYEALITKKLSCLLK